MSEARQWQEIILDFFETTVSKENSTLRKLRENLDSSRRKLISEKNEVKKINLENKFKEKELELKKARISKIVFNEVNEWISKITKTKIGINKRIIKVTHTSKFIHTSANNDGINISLENKQKNEKPYLSTDKFSSLNYDLAHNNGALITISQFLALQNNGNLIIDLILKNDFIFLESFYKNEIQLNEWKKGLSELVENREIKNCYLLKNIYFPINAEYRSYHLLAPLYPTSLADKIFIDRENIKYRKKRNTFSLESERRIFTNMAYIEFGGTKKQNVSMLNFKRKAKGYIFSCQPPTWEQQNNQYLKQKTIFEKGIIRYLSSDIIKYLTDYVIRFQDLGLSLADPKRKEYLERKIDDILNITINYANEIIFNNKQGWTKNLTHNYKIEYQYWLDPYCENQDFIQQRKNKIWMSIWYEPQNLDG